MQINVGDKVQLLNEVGECIVLKIELGHALVEDEHGFEWRVPLIEVIPLTGRGHLSEAIDGAEVPLKSSDIKKSSAEKAAKTAKAEPREIDLHIHNLTVSHRNMSNHEMVTLQMKHFYAAIADAKANGERLLIVIHGVGKGVLKTEIRNALGQMEKCAFEDANYLKYGYGATEITFW